MQEVIEKIKTLSLDEQAIVAFDIQSNFKAARDTVSDREVYEIRKAEKDEASNTHNPTDAYTFLSFLKNRRHA